jgi:hypothetical protein
VRVYLHWQSDVKERKRGFEGGGKYLYLWLRQVLAFTVTASVPNREAVSMLLPVDVLSFLSDLMRFPFLMEASFRDLQHLDVLIDPQASEFRRPKAGEDSNGNSTSALHDPHSLPSQWKSSSLTDSRIPGSHRSRTSLNRRSVDAYRERHTSVSTYPIVRSYGRVRALQGIMAPKRDPTQPGDPPRHLVRQL